MSAPWLLVAGDFSLGGGMDRANYCLAWYLAEQCDRSVSLNFRAARSRIIRVNIHWVPRAVFGALFLNRFGKRLPQPAAGMSGGTHSA